MFLVIMRILQLKFHVFSFMYYVFHRIWLYSPKKLCKRQILGRKFENWKIPVRILSNIQPAFTCSKPAVKTTEQYSKSVQS